MWKSYFSSCSMFISYHSCFNYVCVEKSLWTHQKRSGCSGARNIVGSSQSIRPPAMQLKLPASIHFPRAYKRKKFTLWLSSTRKFTAVEEIHEGVIETLLRPQKSHFCIYFFKNDADRALRSIVSVIHYYIHFSFFFIIYYYFFLSSVELHSSGRPTFSTW